MMRVRTAWLAAAVVLSAGSGLVADVLVLRDGRRIEGTLTGVRGDTIEFEHRNGRDQGRAVRYERDEVRTIEFDEGRSRGRDRQNWSGGSGLRERVLLVESRSQWTDAGIDVRAGQQVQFAATGEYRWGPNRRDGAGGERNSPVNRARPMPDRNAAALIGKIGQEGDPFFIGDERDPIRVRASGRLFLGINDDFLGDNAGSIRVTISY